VDWSLRTCGRKGHVTYAPAEPELRERLHVTTPVGEAWRCLRCADFVVGEPHGSGPADDAPIVLRGRALRDAVILRLLAVERLVRAFVLFGLAYAVIRFRKEQADLKAAFDRALPAAKPLQDALHINLTDSAIVHRVQDLLASRQHTLTLLTLALLAYGVLQLVEGVGLYLLERWGEYVAAVGTAVFLPIEIRELLDRVTFLRVGALVINIAAIVYLVTTKRLFGVRGGHAAYEAERHSASLLEVAQAALDAGGRGPVRAQAG
jgi:uncharacterized membrane protein (DUF2068 family)